MQLRSMLKIYICFSLMEKKKKKKNKSISSSPFYIPLCIPASIPALFLLLQCCYWVSVYQWAISGALVIPCSEIEELSLQWCCSPDYQSALRLSWLRNNLFWNKPYLYKSFGKHSLGFFFSSVVVRVVTQLGETSSMLQLPMGHIQLQEFFLLPP